MIATGRGQNLTYSIAEDLGVAIVTGTYSSNSPFPVEAELCKRYGVSRSILREAVKMLTAKGLLGSRPRRGTWVQDEENWNLLDPDVLRWMLERKFSFALLIEFTQVRLAIEPKAAALAAANAGPSDRAAIAAAIAGMIESERLQDDPLEPDIAFHIAILHASGNGFYSRLGELIEAALRFSIRMTNRQTGVRSVAEHKKVSDAIIAGDAKRAEAAMQALVEDALAQIRKAEQAASPRQRIRAAKARA
ncbi:MAG TPA: FadR/GntR family transcriptional regulator [Rhizomicrobium sp.]|nr:FadR/GntR family transcriptional regulator [Rhizomicrobium sp.]